MILVVLNREPSFCGEFAVTIKICNMLYNCTQVAHLSQWTMKCLVDFCCLHFECETNLILFCALIVCAMSFNHLLFPDYHHRCYLQPNFMVSFLTPFMNISSERNDIDCDERKFLFVYWFPRWNRWEFI